MYKIALIGQTNTGKSTLFNALIEQKKAIISPIPGTTRDRNYGSCQWQNTKLTIIDTGGIEPKGKKDILSNKVKKHIQFAIDEADIIFFITEIRPLTKSSVGPPISDFEREIARVVKHSKKPTLLVLNKADSPKKRSWADSNSWKSLGFNDPFPISAVNGNGIGDLLDAVVDQLTSLRVEPVRQIQAEPVRLIKVAIIGKTNVGKSTLLNALLGEEKVIVSSTPHTTRGPQDTYLRVGPSSGEVYSLILIDTAGIRKRAKIKTSIEKIGVKKSLDMIQLADIILFILDVSEQISHQDKSLLRLIVKYKKGLIVVVNKCDLLSKLELKNLIQSKTVQKSLPLVSWAHFVYISAKNQKNINTIFDLIYKTNQNYKQKISKKDLNKFLLNLIHEKKFNPDVWKKITITQSKTDPTKFILKIPKKFIRKKQVHTAQINIITKQLRKTWGFKGTPIIITTKS